MDSEPGSLTRTARAAVTKQKAKALKAIRARAAASARRLNFAGPINPRPGLNLRDPRPGRSRGQRGPSGDEFQSRADDFRSRTQF